jgi:hypothetical protein
VRRRECPEPFQVLDQLRVFLAESIHLGVQALDLGLPFGHARRGIDYRQNS